MKSGNHKAAWSIAGCCMAVFWSGYLAFGHPGIMATCWQEKYHVGAAETGTVVTFMLFALAVSMFFSGRIHMKIGMRGCILIGTVLNTAAMIILIKADDIYGVYLWGFVANLGCSFIYGPALTTAQQWLPHRRGAASGVVNFVFGISAAAMTPLCSRLLDTAGYEKMNIIILACAAATNIIAVLFAASPDGTPSGAELSNKKHVHEAELCGQRQEASALSAGEAQSHDLTVGQTLKTKSSWIIWIVWVFMGAAGISMISLSKSYALSLGMSGIIVLTAFNVVNGGGRIIAGVLSDRIGGERTAIAAFVMTALAYGALVFMDGLAGIAVAAAFIGFGFGTLFTVTGPIASRLFGLKYFGMIYGLIFTAYGFIGGILGPALSGFVLDRTGGNYGLVFGYLAVFAFIGAALMLLLLRLERDKEKS